MHHTLPTHDFSAEQSFPTHTTVRDPDLASQPNKYATPSGFHVDAEAVHFIGYQSFDLDPTTLALSPHTPSLSLKCGILHEFLTPEFIGNRTVLDLGGNNGFYALTCLGLGAISATVVDMDPEPTGNISRLNAIHPQIPIRGVKGNVVEWNEPADVVFAFALIHWIYNLTTGLGSIDKAVAFLSTLTRHALFIEWVDPSDPVIEDFNHTGLPATADDGSTYTREAFTASLGRHFDEIRFLGAVSPTRGLYLATRRSSRPPERAWHAPLLTDARTKLIQNHELIPGIWSRVYETPDSILKQVSPAHGMHEYALLQVCDHPAIPKATLVSRSDDAVVFRLEKRAGRNLRELTREAPLSIPDAEHVSRRLLDVLGSLQASGIEHRDVHPENILFDPHSKDVTLIDFGWACETASAHPQGTPEALGQLGYFIGRRPSNPPSDMFGWAAVTLWLLRGRPSCLASLAVAAQNASNARAPWAPLTFADLASFGALAATSHAPDVLSHMVAAVGRLTRQVHDELALQGLPYRGIADVDIDALVRRTTELREDVRRTRESLAQQIAENNVLAAKLIPLERDAAILRSGPPIRIFRFFLASLKRSIARHVGLRTGG